MFEFGDRIRSTHGWQNILILDYEKTGEEKRLISPTTREGQFPQFSLADTTGFDVPEGAIVDPLKTTPPDAAASRFPHRYLPIVIAIIAILSRLGSAAHDEYGR